MALNTPIIKTVLPSGLTSSTFDFDITRGSSLNLRFVVQASDGTAENLTGYNVRGSVRRNYSNTGVLLDLNPVLHPSYVSGYVDVTGINGAATASLPITIGVYDIEVYSGAFITKIVRGYTSIYSEATY